MSRSLKDKLFMGSYLCDADFPTESGKTNQVLRVDSLCTLGSIILPLI